MNHCPHEQQLNAYRNGTLSSSESDGVARHLSGCSQCRQRVSPTLSDEHLMARIQALPQEKTEQFDSAPSQSLFPGQGETLLPHIPGYEIIRKLKQGGYGVVYEAIQMATSQRVAIKVLLDGLASDRSLQQHFEREVALATTLQHPNIIKIYDSGAVEGMLYFVMNFVHGQDLVSYVATQQLSTDERLTLFCKVCDAVDHAHQHGVVHRDLKPSNILVDDCGEPVILDFGLARHADSCVAEAETDTPEFAGTLAYAAPESGRGGSNATADQYALGVILFELLTGQLPYPTNGSTQEVLAHIAERPPMLPSSITRECRGDLDAIILKCLAKDARQRYKHVADLSDDLRRYLSDRPVAARELGIGYHTWKFMRRHSLSSALVACLVLSMLWLCAHAVNQHNLLIVERDRAVVAEQLAKHNLASAEAARRQATQAATRLEASLAEMTVARDTAIGVNDWMKFLVRRQRNNGDGGDMSLRELLSSSEAVIRKRFSAHPHIEAEIRTLVGVMYARLDDCEESKRNLDRSIRLRRQLGHGNDVQSAYALVEHANALAECGEFEPAISRVARAAEIMRDGEPSDVIWALNAHGKILSMAGRLSEAADVYRDALAVPGDSGRKRLSHEWLSRTLAAQNRYDDAAELLEVRRQQEQQLHGPRSYKALTLRMDIAILRMHNGDLADAEREAREAARHILEKWPSRPKKCINAQVRLATVLLNAGNAQEAEALARHAVGHAQSKLGMSSSATALAVCTLAEVLLSVERREEARDLLSTIRPDHGTLPQWDELIMARWRGLTGECDTALEFYASAEVNLLQSYAVLKRRYDHMHTDFQLAVERLVRLYSAWGKGELAEQYRSEMTEDVALSS